MLSHRELAVLRPLSSPDWLFELKWDGYRVLAIREAEVRLISRPGEI